MSYLSSSAKIVIAFSISFQHICTQISDQLPDVFLSRLTLSLLADNCSSSTVTAQTAMLWDDVFWVGVLRTSSRSQRLGMMSAQCLGSKSGCDNSIRQRATKLLPSFMSRKVGSLVLAIRMIFGGLALEYSHWKSFNNNRFSRNCRETLSRRHCVWGIKS